MTLADFLMEFGSKEVVSGRKAAEEFLENERRTKNLFMNRPFSRLIQFNVFIYDFVSNDETVFDKPNGR